MISAVHTSLGQQLEPGFLERRISIMAASSSLLSPSSGTALALAFCLSLATRLRLLACSLSEDFRLGAIQDCVWLSKAYSLEGASQLYRLAHIG